MTVPVLQVLLGRHGTREKERDKQDYLCYTVKSIPKIQIHIKSTLNNVVEPATIKVFRHRGFLETAAQSTHQVWLFSDPYAAPQNTLAWKHRARALTENLVFHSGTSWSYSVSVSSTSVPGRIQEQIMNCEEITEITEDSSISQELVPPKNTDSLPQHKRC